jgi:hypothetical protein
MSSLRQLLSRGSAAPQWLRTRLSTAMTALVQSPGGVDATLEAFLGAGSEANEKAQAMVAALLARVPAAVTSEAYVAAVGPQILALLRRAALVQQSAAVSASAAAGSVLSSVAVARRVGALLTGRLAAVAPAATAAHLLQGVLRPLALFLVPAAAVDSSSVGASSTATSTATAGAAAAGVCAGATVKSAAAAASSSSSGDSTTADQWVEVVSEKELDTCIRDLEGLLLETAPPPALITAMMTAFSSATAISTNANDSSNSVIVPLFRLHCLCCASKSRLLQPSGALLQLLLQRLPAAQAARHLQAAIMPLQRHYSSSTSSSSSASGNSAVWEAEFAAGSSGGAVVRVPNRSTTATAATSGSVNRQQAASASSALLEMESLLSSSLTAGIDLDSLQVSFTTYAKLVLMHAHQL